MREPPTQTLVKGLFRVWSHVYDQPVFQWTIYSRVHRRLLAEGRTLGPSRILDIGCGTGELLGSLARQWPDAELTGIDLSPDMLAKARAKRFTRAVTWVEGSVYELPFDDGAFDLVTNTVSSHFYVEGERAFREIGRVLAPGGTLLQASLTTGPLSYIPGLGGRSIALPGAIYRGPEEQRRLLEAGAIELVSTQLVLPGVRLYRGTKH